MKYSIKLIILALLLLTFVGCEQAAQKQQQTKISDAVYNTYAPVKIEVMPLTEKINVQDGSIIKAYISLLDKFDSQIKYPAVFRFELYQKVQYSQIKGKRLHIWPDFNLADALKNNNYWMDTFRAYKFELDFKFQPGSKYLLQITCVLPNGRRLVTDFEL